jgi:uncharacterized protein (DUF1015 family)
MATIKPFAALRPKPNLAERVCELPYDVMSSAEAREMAAGNHLSFLHVSKPEIDLPAEIDPSDPRVYAKGKENFSNLLASGVLSQDPQPSFYLYRQIMGRHSQAGFVAVASCDEYLNDTIKKHERTRPDKEDDRVQHIESLNCQTGPVFLIYRSVPALEELITRESLHRPDIDFTAKDGVRHSSWVIRDALTARQIEEEFQRLPALFIADGHHRSAAAARVFQSRKGAGNSGYFLSVIFPHNQMQILPYHRAVKDLNGLTPAQLLEKLSGIFRICQPGAARPARKHELGLYLGNHWHTLQFQPELAATDDPMERLDVTLLQKHVLAPLLGIDDPRTSKRIQFIGGIRGTAELEKLVNIRECACAFSMYPTGIEDLMSIADAGGLMPPKSTWFEPKLRDAMFCHMI